MVHALVYHGSFELNFPRLAVGGTEYLATDGTAFRNTMSRSSNWRRTAENFLPARSMYPITSPSTDAGRGANARDVSSVARYSVAPAASRGKFSSNEP